MSDSWFFARGGQKFGPFAFEQIRQMAASGLLSPLDMVQDGSTGRWLSACAVEGLFAPHAGGKQPASPSSGDAGQDTPVLAALAEPDVKPPPTRRPDRPERVAGREPESAPDSPQRTDTVLALAALVSIPLLCLNEMIGKPFLAVAGLIWLVVGVRALLTGTAPTFSGTVSRRPVLYRVAGLPLALLGVVLIVGGLKDFLLAGAGPDRPGRNSSQPAPGTNEEMEIARLLLLGVEQIKKGEPEKAEQTFSQTIRLDPSRPEGYAGRGWAHLARGEYDKTIADCTESIRRDPRFAMAYSRRGGAYKMKGELDRAIADLTEAIKINPNDGVTYVFRAGAHFEKGQDDLALADYGEAIRLSPDSALYVARASIRLLKGDHDGAIADCTEAIKLNDKNAEAYRLRSKAYRAKGDDGEAEADRIRAHQFAPAGKGKP